SLSITNIISRSNGLNILGLSNLQALNATNINATSLTTTGNVGVVRSFTTYRSLDLLNVSGNTSLNTLGVVGSSTFNSTVALNNLSSSTGSTLCLNASNQIVTCTGSSALTGTGVNGGVSYWTSANNLTYSAANFFFDA